MINVIEVTPNKDGRMFITLYGTRYEIKIKNNKKNNTSSNEGNGEQ